MNWRLLFFCVYLCCHITISGANDVCSRLCSSGTCCEKEFGHFLCCPVENGLCCPGAETCCPQGSQCNSDGSCSAGNNGLFSYLNQFFWPAEKSNSAKQTTAAPVFDDIRTNAITCHPSESQCISPDGRTGCCPFKDAVCCGDHAHCCPSGYRCDFGNSSCVEIDAQEPVSHMKIHVYHKSDRNCPAPSSSCLELETCCQISDEQQACCPLKDADCCADGQHCCPKGTKCNSKSNGCDRIGVVNPFLQSPVWLNKTLNGAPSPPSSIICPDRKSTCEYGSTCCEMQDHSYGCCPTTNAVCCSDGLHCCPEGLTCDNERGTCSTKAKSRPISTTMKSTTPLPKTTIACDKNFSCTDDSTCCPIDTHTWGCCPFPKAVCCSDGDHCCPSGTTCDLKNAQCIDEVTSSVKSWMSKTPSIAVSNTTTLCPDSRLKCPNSSTCCKNNGLEHPYSCCPHPEATCCSDGEHCCPKGYKCHGSSCMIDEQILAEPDLTEVTICGDGHTECSINSKCCQKEEGGVWSCCPIMPEKF